MGQLGEAFVITLKLMDVHNAQVVHRASESFRADESQLPLALRFATWQLLGHPLAGRGRLTIKANVDEGEVALGSEDARPYPKAAFYDQLAVGKYGLTMTADGYLPQYKETYVLAGKTTALRMSLLEEPREWYEEWYTWAIVGGVIVAGVVTAVVLAPDDPGPGQVVVGF